VQPPFDRPAGKQVHAFATELPDARPAQRVDVSHFAIANAIRQGLLRKPVDTQSTIAWVDEPTLSRPCERAAEDQSCEAGVAVKRTPERALACAGKLAEAEPKFEAGRGRAECRCAAGRAGARARGVARGGRDCVYPATDLKLRFEAPALQK